VVSLINCVQSGTVYVSFFAAVTPMRAVVRAALPKLRRATNTTSDSAAHIMSTAEARHSELEMIDVRRSADETSGQTSR